jgi:hypothetical protein
MIASWNKPRHKPYKYRIAGRFVYERVSRGRFRRIHSEDVDDVPVQILAHEIMFRIPGTREYMKTHEAILVTGCDNCGAEIGEPCRGVDNPHFEGPRPVSYACYLRREAWKRIKKRR